MPKEADFDNMDTLLAIPPHHASGWSVVGKVIIGGIIGALNAFLIFLLITLLGRELFMGGATMLVPLILSLIAFLGTCIGNIAIGGSYNLFYSNTYYDFSKIFSLILISNTILLFVISPLYFAVGSQGNAAFLVLAFHIFFSVFISQAMLEMSSNPNYAGSALLGTLMGMSLSVLIYLGIYAASATHPNLLLFLMVTPPLIAFIIIPLTHSIRSTIYYKMYEVGNNFLYIPSLSEVAINEEEMDTNTDIEDDITVSME